MKKTELFTLELQELSSLAKLLSHPARLAIIEYLAEEKTCISGDISDHLPLSRTTVSQHLKELKSLGLIKGSVDGLTIKYCLNKEALESLKFKFNEFFTKVIPNQDNKC